MTSRILHYSISSQSYYNLHWFTALGTILPRCSCESQRQWPPEYSQFHEGKFIEYAMLTKFLCQCPYTMLLYLPFIVWMERSGFLQWHCSYKEGRRREWLGLGQWELDPIIGWTNNAFAAVRAMIMLWIEDRSWTGMNCSHSISRDVVREWCVVK